ncbi:hypothetical protein K3495_g11936 [Podosphaera aphanis]|nr:hypothetical protein K3495_g11936 [Podosphaera aphanis]
MAETRSDLVDHPYIQVVDVWELDIHKKKKRRTRLVNIYDNWIGRGQLWQGEAEEKRRAIQDVDWETVIEGRTILVGDFNAHSIYWNPECRRRERAETLEALIDKYELIVNNDMAVPTRPKNTAGHSIIDLTITTPALGFVAAWSIDPEYATPSDHELITFDLENLEYTQGCLGPSKEVTGWALKDLTTEQEKNMENQWKAIAEEHPAILTTCRREELDLEAQWISDILAQMFDHNCKTLRICARSKRWWNDDVSQARSQHKAQRRKFQSQEISLEEYKVNRNAYYRKIRKAKDQCFEKWIQGNEEPPKGGHEGFLENDNLHHTQKWQDDNERCWTALRYTKSWCHEPRGTLDEWCFEASAGR